MKTGVQVASLDFSDFSGGINNTLPPHAIKENQCSDALNVLIEREGFTRAPGYEGLNSTPYSDQATGFWIWRQSDGSELWLLIQNGNINAVDPTTGDLTVIAPFEGSAQCYGFSLMNKFWIANSNSFYKVEDSIHAYPVAIEPPTSGTFTQSWLPGGTLPMGTYSAYASYARKVDGTIILYSNPFYLGSVYGSGSLNATVDIGTESDGQANTVAIWMTDANGAVHYFYDDAPNNGENIQITGAHRNDDLLMTVEASPFYKPPVFQQIFTFDNRIWGWTENSNILYYSLKAGTAYDLEKWFTPALITGNRITIPENIISIFNVSGNLYINTYGGIYELPNADVSSKLLIIEPRLYFPYPKSVVGQNSVMFGATNDGIRYFNGQNFSYDLSREIRPFYDQLVAGASSSFQPVGFIYRRPGKRTELHICYRDLTVSELIHNGHLILNLDRTVLASQQPFAQDPDDISTPWEKWSDGFSDMTIQADGTFVALQASVNGSSICRETNSKSNKNIFSQEAEFLTVSTSKRLYLKSKIKVPDIAGAATWDKQSPLTINTQSYTIKLTRPDQNNLATTNTIAASGSTGDLPILGSAGITLPFVLPIEYPVSPLTKTPLVKPAKMIFAEFTQLVSDDKFQLFKYTIYGKIEGSIFT